MYKSNIQFTKFSFSNPRISNWKKLYRIKLKHNFVDLKVRGLSTQEVALRILSNEKYYLALDKLEIDFVKSMLK